MGFIQSAYIKCNTPDIINKLEELKYNNGWYHCLKCNTIGTNIAEDNKGYYYGIMDERDIKPNQIDCNNNIDLFFAIAALRDDTDINQWFICTISHYDAINNITHEVNDWILCTTKKIKKHKKIDVWRKASVNELINHFI